MLIISNAVKPNSKVPRNVHVRALSYMSTVQWDNRTISNIDSVYRSLFFANECASLGFVSPTVFFVGKGFQRIAETRKFQETEQPRFKTLVFLWEVLERSAAESSKKDSKRNAKIEKDPMSYVCAAPGCGIEATRKSGLMRCAGKCPAGVKPAYCSKECQRTGWKRHKPNCREDARVPSPEPNGDESDEGSVAEASATNELAAGNPNPVLGDEIRDDGREIRIALPGHDGRTTILSSKTMTPTFLKALRDQLKARVGEESDIEF